MTAQVYSFESPQINLLGVGSAKQVGEQFKQLGCSKALIVTGKVVKKLEFVDNIVSNLHEQGIEVAFYSEVEPNPTDKNIADGVAQFKNEKCDGIVAIGGGSSLDAGKAIALVAANGGQIHDYAGINQSEKPMVPMVAVNTTAGTASEMTRIAVITDTSEAKKMVIVDKHITPNVSINDPELTVPLTRELTAGTGMDALTHAIEAYVSILANPTTDGNALQAIRLVSENLRAAVENGENLEARKNMTFAQFSAGLAFNNALLGYVHAIAHQLGGVYNLPHGMCNAVLLPHVMKFNLDAKPQAFARIAVALGVDIRGLSDEEAGKKGIEAVSQLAKDVGVPSSLAEMGVKEEDIQKLAEMSMKDPCALFNPKEAKLDDVINIIKSAMKLR